MITNAFNNNYSNIGRDMAQRIIHPVKSYHDFLTAKSNLKSSFRLIDTEETNSVIKK